MNFWIIAVALLMVSAAVISWPLLTGTSRERFLGLVLLLLMPLAGLFLYQQIGAPDALNMASPRVADEAASAHTTDAPSMQQLIVELQQNLEENPNNPEGWLMLGRSLKSMQQYPEALSAIQKADQQLPGTPVIMVELAEAKLFASGNPNMGGEIHQLLATAISMDPQQQKGLWLLGMAESQAGNYDSAVRYWTTLQGLLDPASGAAQTVAQQIESAKQQSGGIAVDDSQSADSPPAASHSFSVDLGLDESLPPPPSNSVLFVFVHPAGQKGMPLAVKRIATPVFPLSISLSDADTLRPGSSLSDHEKLDVSARVSMSGVANAASGDYQANTATVDSNSVSTIVLRLDQRVP